MRCDYIVNEAKRNIISNVKIEFFLVINPKIHFAFIFLSDSYVQRIFEKWSLRGHFLVGFLSAFFNVKIREKVQKKYGVI